MTDLRTAAQQALEALRHVVRQAQENLVPTIHYGPVNDVINRLEAALAQRKPLTNEEIKRLWYDNGAGIELSRFSSIARAVERALEEEKNRGR